ncbi:hypothetical protein AB4279_15325, partial [Vibrio cyclitrophicus]
ELRNKAFLLLSNVLIPNLKPPNIQISLSYRDKPCKTRRDPGYSYYNLLNLIKVGSSPNLPTIRQRTKVKCIGWFLLTKPLWALKR